MLYLVVFSLSIISATLWHSVLLSGIFAFIVFIVAWIITRNAVGAFASLGVVIVGVLLVSFYDMRVAVHDESNLSNSYIVQARETTTRYRIVSGDGKLYFLYSHDNSLSPGDRIALSSKNTSIRADKNIWRRPLPSLSGQFGQQVDRQSLEREFDYDSWLYMRGIAGSIFDDHPRHQDSAELPRYSQLKSYLSQNLGDSIDSDTSHALGVAMLLGDRSQLSDHIYQNFIDSGLVHLIAVSGTHIAIMLALAGIVLLRVPFYPRIILLCALLVSYALIVGFRASIVRASIMSGLTLLLFLPGRKISIWRLLAYARVLILAFNPYMLVYDLGFALSFSALCGILWMDKIFETPLGVLKRSHTRIKNILYHILRILLASVGATIGILPVLGLFTGTINLLSPLLNAIIIIRVPLTMALLTLTSIVAGPFVGSLVDRILSQYLHLAAFGAEHAIMLELGTLGSALLLLGAVTYFIRWTHNLTSTVDDK